MEVFESISVATFKSVSNILLASQTSMVFERLDGPLSGTAMCCLTLQSLPVLQRNMRKFCNTLSAAKNNFNLGILNYFPSPD